MSYSLDLLIVSKPDIKNVKTKGISPAVVQLPIQRIRYFLKQHDLVSMKLAGVKVTLAEICLGSKPDQVAGVYQFCYSSKNIPPTAGNSSLEGL